jgi:hypothetical protein
MILSDVVMGKVIKLTRTDTSLIQVRCPDSVKCPLAKPPRAQPPYGFDAVIGEPGGDLNYDECVGT